MVIGLLILIEVTSLQHSLLDLQYFEQMASNSYKWLLIVKANSCSLVVKTLAFSAKVISLIPMTGEEIV